jgi:hypothetical protein
MVFDLALSIGGARSKTVYPGSDPNYSSRPIREFLFANLKVKIVYCICGSEFACENNIAGFTGIQVYMTTKNSGNLSPDEDVLEILIKSGLISADQKQEIQVKKPRVKNRLEQIRVMGTSPSAKSKILNPVTIVDIITSLELQRPDAPGKTLDEETIYLALARAWKMP